MSTRPSYASDEFDYFMEKAMFYRYDSVDSALYFGDKAKALALASSDRECIGKVNNLFGGIYYVHGNFTESLKAYKEAFDIFENSTNLSEKAKALNGLGLIKLAQHQYQDAINIWEKSLQINLATKDSFLLAKNYFNIGLATSELGNYKDAFSYLHQAIAIANKNSDQLHLRMSQNRMGKVHYEIGDLDSAKYYYTAVLNSSEKPNNWELTFAYTGLAEVAIAQSDFQSSLIYGKEAYSYGLLINALWDLERATAALAESYANLGDYKEAYHFSVLNKAHKDSLYSKEKNREVNALQLQIVEGENIRLLQDKELAEEKARLNLFLIVGLLAVILFLIILTWGFRKNLHLKESFSQKLRLTNLEIEKQKDQVAQRNLELNQVNDAKNKLFSILSHDLRTPIHTIKQFMQMDSMNIFDEEEQKLAKELLLEQIEKTDKLLNNLLEWAKTQLEGIHPFTQTIFIPAIMEDVIGIFEHQAKVKKIAVSHQNFETISRIEVDKGHLQVILRNLYNNAIKFTPKNGSINIFYSEGEDFVSMHVRDSGVGMEEVRRSELENKLSFTESKIGTDNEAGSGLGLLLVKQFLQHNNGTLSIVSQVGNGTEVIVSFIKSPVFEKQLVDK